MRLTFLLSYATSTFADRPLRIGLYGRQGLSNSRKAVQQTHCHRVDVLLRGIRTIGTAAESLRRSWFAPCAVGYHWHVALVADWHVVRFYLSGPNIPRFSAANTLSGYDRALRDETL